MTEAEKWPERWVDTTSVRRSTRNSDRRAPVGDRIIEAAAKAIEVHGPDASTAQIAQLAGVARPHVYRHFASKDDLSDQLVKHAAGELKAAVRPTLAPTATALEAVSGPVGAAVDWAAEHPNLYRFMTQRSQARPRPPGAARTHLLDEILTATAAYLARNAIDDEPPSAVLAGLMGMVDASIIWWLDHGDEERGELVDRLSGQVWLVLGALLEKRGLRL